MASSDTRNKTLGNKHKEHNERVRHAISSQKPLEEKEFVKSADDLDNLKKIDIASYTKDVDYILSVLKSDDMLYISRAIKKSPWIVHDQYANVINPEFLNQHLFPTMKTKASIKFLKHIRHYLRNENRVEEFYKHETNEKSAAKWLSRCSINFIENNINKHITHMSDMEFKRLCERSVTIFEVSMKKGGRNEKLKAASFLLHTHADMYLDVFENTNLYSRPKFGPTVTDLIMKKTPGRIINNFVTYVHHIHIPTFIKHLNREQVKDFLFNLANTEVKGNNQYWHRTVFDFKIMKLFVKRMPKGEQFEFVKKVYLDKENKIQDETLQRGTEMFAIKILYTQLGMPIHNWYVFAPFNIAFDELKKLIQSETILSMKNSMYDVLLKCALENRKMIETQDFLDVLIYHSKNCLKDDKTRSNFINKFILETDIYKNDQENWKIFTDILNEINQENTYPDYNTIVALHCILHNKSVPKAIEKDFLIDSLKNYRKKLNQHDQNKVFDYIYNYFVNKIQSHVIETENEFSQAVQIVSRLLNEILNWDKELADFPFTLEKIKGLIQIRKENSWKINMSLLYNKKKSWKRLMFEESVGLNPSQNVFMNALKHNPGLLARYKSDVDIMCCDDAVSLKRLLRKLRIYWPETLANSWTKSYFDRIDHGGGYNALTRGLCTLLSQEPLSDFITKYAPAQPKIDWNNTDELILGLQRCLAKNMHIARPQPSADSILLYAKGDFLQYALPSVLAIYYDMSYVEIQEHISKLLNAPVSLQKHGLRLAFSKLKHDELKFHLSNTWHSSKNISIRAVSFGLLFDLMCKEKNAAKAEELWEILEAFIENLTFKEDKKIYEKLLKIDDVPETIQPKFLVKSYKFLITLLPHIKIDREIYENGIRKLTHYTRKIMEYMCPEFVANIVTEYLDANFYKYGGFDDSMLKVTSSYLLCAKNEETQNNKYNKIVVPLIKRAMNQWNEIHNDIFFIRRNFQNFLEHLNRDMKEYVVKRKMIVPTKMFQNIQNELNGSLLVPQNYVMLRMWQLVTKVAEILEKTDNRNDWQQICLDIVTEIGAFCLEVLKHDVKAYFPCIYVLFEKALQMCLKNMKQIVFLQIYEMLLSDKKFIQAYLLVISMLPHYKEKHSDKTDECTVKGLEIKKLIHMNPSVEVKMHYYCKYGDGE